MLIPKDFANSAAFIMLGDSPLTLIKTTTSFLFRLNSNIFANAFS